MLTQDQMKAKDCMEEKKWFVVINDSHQKWGSKKGRENAFQKRVWWRCFDAERGKMMRKRRKMGKEEKEK
jgi:hypothetical protein